MFGHRPFTVIANGIHTRQYAFHSIKRQELQKELGLENKFVLSTVGRLSPVKNHSFLLRVLRTLTEKRQNVHLLLIGDGELRKELQEQAKDLPVTFVGLTDKVEAYLSASDLFVLPSLFEGFPLSAMEAQASGLTCLLADTITQEVNVTGNSLYLPLEEADWVSALCVLERQPDRSYRSAQAQELMQKQGFDNEKISAALREYYRNAVERAGT